MRPGSSGVELAYQFGMRLLALGAMSMQIAVEREIRRLVAERDARVLTEHGVEDDLDLLVEWSVGNLQAED